MFVPINPTTITPVWLVVFGLLVLLWSPLSVAMGALLLMVGLAGPLTMLILWSDPTPTGAPAVARVEES
jgi:hypothetical protein